MPYSEPTFDDAVAKFIAKCNASHYLDIGVGAGKYGRIIRASNPDATIVGIESEAAYLREFQLAKLYTKLIHGRVQRFIARHPDFATDIAIIGDCIEHLKKASTCFITSFIARDISSSSSQRVMSNILGDATPARRIARFGIGPISASFSTL